MKRIATLLICMFIVFGTAGCENSGNAKESYKTNGNIDDQFMKMGFTGVCTDEECIITKDDQSFKVTSKDLIFYEQTFDTLKIVFDLALNTVSLVQNNDSLCNYNVENNSGKCDKEQTKLIEDSLTDFEDLLDEIGIDQARLMKYFTDLNTRKAFNISDYIDTSKVTKPIIEEAEIEQIEEPKEEIETPQPEPESTPSPAPEEKKEPTISTGQANAQKKAVNYLNVMAFSYQGLVEQLEYEGFTSEEAIYGVDHCGANWSEQALKKAKSYLNTMAFSYTGLMQQLEYEGFSTQEASYGVDHCGADWFDQAAKKAKSYMDSLSFSREGLIDQLLYEGFTQEQAEHGASTVGY